MAHFGGRARRKRGRSPTGQPPPQDDTPRPEDEANEPESEPLEQPIPAQAATIVAFILTCMEPEVLAALETNRVSVLIPLVIILSALMISTVRFDGIPKITPLFIRREPWKALAMAVAMLLILFLRETGLFISLTVYIFFSLGRAIYFAVRTIWDETSPGPLEEYE
jgi:CDP-diacylglycerol---serine O-phosphatidyltransferase